jgi:hypothetical protein
MKKIHSVIPVVVSIVVSGCSSSDSTPVDTNMTPITCSATQYLENGKCVDSNQTSCEKTQHLENGKCVDDSNQTNPTTCETGKIKDANGSCIDIVCDTGQHLEGNNCIKNPDPVFAKISGTAFDGLISGATISSCEIVNDIKIDANATCTSSKVDGTFSCEYLAINGDKLIVKAVGGKDLGSDDIVSLDDKTNNYILKTIFQKETDINSTKVFASPLSTLVVQKMADSNWSKPIATAESEVKDALNTGEDIFADSQAVRKLAGAIANIWDTTSDLNLSVFAQEPIILTAEGKISAGLITRYNSKILPTVEITLVNEIEKIYKAERNETIAEEKTLDLLVDRAEANLSISDKIAENFEKVVDKNYNTSKDTLSIVANITDKNVTVEDIVSLSENIEKILIGATDKTLAIEIINDKINNKEPLEDLNISIVNSAIAKKVCELKGTGFEFDSITEKCNVVTVPLNMKDAVNSPDDIPALPTDDAKTIQPDNHPSISSDNNYSAMPTGNDYNNSYETKYSDLNFSSDANITTTPHQI